MGKMKELQIETQNLARDWEGLVEDILSQPAVGSAVALKPDEMPATEDEYEQFRLVPDLRFQPLGLDHSVAIEIRMFRWHRDWHQRISDSIAHMHEILSSDEFDRGIIVTTVDLPDNLRTQLYSPEDRRVEVWGVEKLRELAEGNDALSSILDELLSETILDDDLRGPLKMDPELRQGRMLADKLRQTPAGLKGWRDFELLTEEAIRLLFGRDLSNINAQQRTDDGLNRMDLIGRIKTEGGSFWAMVASDFSTRYVVFDAKNSHDPITQQEIQITEKYLFARGLRTFAVVIARNGADQGASKLVETQLRENGKFILVITLAELCAMLEGADVGEAPENLLFERMDYVLMRMGR
ncbi:hypothetical protein [Rhizobium leguminosarum]|uniref:hypothetical protein n=1 Tax=Rhizobium leguminosarum TaxID=384 RepID=UPI001C93FCE9|nr:hypothetical protein [Rhizobium leguminosarum]MBY5579129.1 hypothetical protein [Rhizobium leguminosarum]